MRRVIKMSACSLILLVAAGCGAPPLSVFGTQACGLVHNVQATQQPFAMGQGLTQAPTATGMDAARAHLDRAAAAAHAGDHATVVAALTELRANLGDQQILGNGNIAALINQGISQINEAPVNKREVANILVSQIRAAIGELGKQAGGDAQGGASIKQPVGQGTSLTGTVQQTGSQQQSESP